MVCRNPERGQKAVQDVISATGNTDVHLQGRLHRDACRSDQAVFHLCCIESSTCTLTFTTCKSAHTGL